MSRTLDLSLACENYGTGASYTISYAEERSQPDLVEHFTPEGSGAVRTFYTAWEDRFNFIENMLGFAKVNPSGTDGISSDATGFNGRHIHRVSPKGYNMGLLDGTDEPTSWVYATRATVTTNGAKSNSFSSIGAIYTPRAEYAKIAVTFSALDYDITGADSAYLYTGSGGAGTISYMEEWLRYGRIIQKPASIFFQYPQQVLQEVSYPRDGVVGNPLINKPIPQPINVLDNIADFWLYLYDIPYDPIVGVNECFGAVNKFAIFATPDFTDGQPAESLHLVAADIVRLPLRCGRRYWNLQLGFRKVFNRDYDGTTFRGHNYIRDSVTNGGVKQLRFYRVAADPANPTAIGSSMIPIVDFGKLFWISSAIP